MWGSFKMKKGFGKLEGFIPIDKKQKCSYPYCRNKPIISTIMDDKIKGLKVEKIHFWCKKHYDQLKKGKWEE